VSRAVFGQQGESDGKDTTEPSNILSQLIISFQHRPNSGILVLFVDVDAPSTRSWLHDVLQRITETSASLSCIFLDTVANIELAR